MKSAFLSLEDPQTVSLLDETSLWSAPFGELLLEAVPCRSGMKFLDIGPGTGFPLLELAQRLGDSEAFGIDPWDRGRERIESKSKLLGLRNVRIMPGVGEKLPFEKNYFDLIVSNNGLNNVADIGKTLDECRRTLRRNAPLVFTVNLPGSMREFYIILKKVLRRNDLEDIIPAVDRHIHSKRLQESEWISLLRGHGFTGIVKRKSTFSFRFSDASAMFNHFFMRIAFIPAWDEIVPEADREKIFGDVRRELDRAARAEGSIHLTIPMICFTCRKK